MEIITSSINKLMTPPGAYAVAVPVSVLVAVGIVRRWRSSRWGVCTAQTSLRGKTFLITGANSGIGLETAKALVKRNARVIFACRDLDKAKTAIAEIRKGQPKGGEMIPMQLDLSSFKSIESFVDVVKAGFHKIDVLINNAGVAIPLSNDLKTQEGFEIHLGVNHLGHFYLTSLLTELLKRGSPSRVIVVSSTLHERGKINFKDINLRSEIKAAKEGKPKGRQNPGYNNSKLMNVYFARELADRLQTSGVDVNACCPGFTYTNLFRYSIKWYHYIIMAPIFLWFMRTAEQGAQTVIYLATEYSLQGTSGRFFRDCAEIESKYKFQKDEQTNLWKASEEMVMARKVIPLEYTSLKSCLKA